MQFTCPACQKLLSINPAYAGQMTTCPLCQANIQIPVLAQPAPAPSSSFSGIIPTKNKAALFGYYFGVFSLIPILGIPLGITAIILGLKGLQFVKKNPAAKGTTHAWIALILGILTTLASIALVILVIGAIGSA